jgi:hypothetical protein
MKMESGAVLDLFEFGGGGCKWILPSYQPSHYDH